MKPWKIILSIVLILISITRLASTCNKQKKAALKKEFAKRLGAIESARAGIYVYQSTLTDSVPGLKNRRQFYNRVVDSSIDYYRGIYLQDEPRYKQYLKVLFGYKKLAYEYQNIGKLYADKDLSKEKKEYRYREIQNNIRSVTLDLDRDRLAAMWDIFN